MVTSYGTGQYSASGTEAHCCAQSRLAKPGARGIIYCHALGGNALDVIGKGSGVDFSPITRTIQDLATPILAGDLNGDAWGNDTAQTRLTSAYNYVQSAFGAKPGKVILLGVSMGGLTALNWARNNPTLVQALVIFYPVVNLQAQHDGTGGATAFATSTQNAYGGSLSTFNAAVATHDPAQNAASYTGAFPLRIYYSTADTVAGTANQTAFISAVGGASLTSVNLGAVTHGDMTQVNAQDVTNWLKAYV